jgi:hypothetical protein
MRQSLSLESYTNNVGYIKIRLLILLEIRLYKLLLAFMGVITSSDNLSVFKAAPESLWRLSIKPLLMS